MKNTSLKFLNPILLVLFLVAAVAMVGYKITEGSTWRGAHEFSGILFIVVGLLHLYFNWGWVRANFLKKKNHKK